MQLTDPAEARRLGLPVPPPRKRAATLPPLFRPVSAVYLRLAAWKPEAASIRPAGPGANCVKGGSPPKPRQYAGRSWSCWRR